MSATPANLQMVGLIPMPDSAYDYATKANLGALRQAMTPQGLKTAGLRPPPARMMPVGQDATGNLYALVETCNPNHRPTAVPLSSFYPVDPARPGDPPPEFIPLDVLRNAPPPPQEVDSDNALTAGGHAAGPRASATDLDAAQAAQDSQLLRASPEEERQLSQRATEALLKANSASNSAAPASAPSSVGSSMAVPAEALAKTGGVDAALASAGFADAAPLAQASQQAAQLTQAVPGIPAPKAATSASQAATQAAQIAQATQAGSAGAGMAASQAASGFVGLPQAAPGAVPRVPQFDTVQSERLIRAMQHMQAGREARTQALLRQAAQATGRPDVTGGLGSTVLGVTAAQDPAQSQALFQQMAAEKAAGLQPGGGIYRRLQAALASGLSTPTGA